MLRTQMYAFYSYQPSCLPVASPSIMSIYTLICKYAIISKALEFTFYLKIIHPPSELNTSHISNNLISFKHPYYFVSWWTKAHAQHSRLCMHISLWERTVWIYVQYVEMMRLFCISRDFVYIYTLWYIGMFTYLPTYYNCP